LRRVGAELVRPVGGIAVFAALDDPIDIGGLPLAKSWDSEQESGN
jgi:hypothetical protein